MVSTFSSMKSRKSLKMGHVGSKARSLVQFLEKPCVCSRGHIFSAVLMKFGQNVCLSKILDELKMGHMGSKSRSQGQIIEEPMLVTKGLRFKSLLFNLYHTIRKAQVSDSRAIITLLFFWGFFAIMLSIFSMIISFEPI